MGIGRSDRRVRISWWDRRVGTGLVGLAGGGPGWVGSAGRGSAEARSSEPDPMLASKVSASLGGMAWSLSSDLEAVLLDTGSAAVSSHLVYRGGSKEPIRSMVGWPSVHVVFSEVSLNVSRMDAASATHREGSAGHAIGTRQ